MGRGYTLFNPDSSCLGSRTTSGRKHLLNQRGLERAKRALGLHSPPTLVHSITDAIPTTALLRLVHPLFQI